MSPKKHNTHWGGGGPAAHTYSPGDTIVFGYEGNLRARVEGFEVVAGPVWLRCRALLDFEVPLSQVVCVEPEGE